MARLTVNELGKTVAQNTNDIQAMKSDISEMKSLLQKALGLQPTEEEVEEEDLLKKYEPKRSSQYTKNRKAYSYAVCERETGKKYDEEVYEKASAEFRAAYYDKCFKK